MYTSWGTGGGVILEITKVGRGWNGESEAGGFRGREKGITGVRTVGSVMFLANKNNVGLGEEFSRKKIIC